MNQDQIFCELDIEKNLEKLNIEEISNQSLQIILETGNLTGFSINRIEKRYPKLKS